MCVCSASNEHFKTVVFIRPSVKGMFVNTEFAFTYKIHLKDKKSAFFPGERKRLREREEKETALQRVKAFFRNMSRSV